MRASILCFVLRMALFVAGWICTAGLIRADRAAEIARIHVEAIGGLKRIDALRSMRMTGVVETPTNTVPITLLAARPARLRVESIFGTRKMLQAWDGVGPPWQRDLGDPSAAYATLSGEAAQRFVADADFDDPLVRWEQRGYQIEFAGGREISGRRLFRLLVARKLTENIFLLLDPQTYFIVLRIQQLTREGESVELVTRYEDYRPVGGVLVPHRIALSRCSRAAGSTSAPSSIRSKPMCRSPANCSCRRARRAFNRRVQRLEDRPMAQQGFSRGRIRGAVASFRSPVGSVDP
jgi:hypothetical protein